MLKQIKLTLIWVDFPGVRFEKGWRGKTNRPPV